MPTDALLPGEMVNICAALQAIAGHVVVDLPSVFNDYVLALIEAADEVLLVGSMDIPSIKNLKIGMQTLDLHAIAGPKLRLVLNHANAKVKLDVKEIERVLGLSANFPVPDDIAVPISVNAGGPVVVDEPKAPVSRALDRIAESLLGTVGGKTASAQERAGTAGRSTRGRSGHDADPTARCPLAGTARRCRASPQREHALEEMRQKMHQFVIHELGPLLTDQRVSEGRAPAPGRRAAAQGPRPGATRADRRRAPGSSCSPSPTTCSATGRSTSCSATSPSRKSW